MPAEWEPHRATWIAWPHFEPDWPGKLAPIPWVYGEIVRVLAPFEPIEILCQSEAERESARAILTAEAAHIDRVRFHLVPTDRSWLRDSAPTGVVDATGAVSLAELGVQRLGEVRQLAPGRGGRTSDRRSDRLAANRAAACGHRRADRARRRRDRCQRAGSVDGNRGMAAERRAGQESWLVACRITNGSSRTGWASAGPSGSATAVRAMTRTVTWTTSRGSSRRTRSS